MNSELRDRMEWLKAALLLHGIDSASTPNFLASARRGCSVYTDNAVSVPNDSPTALVFDAESWDAAGYHDNSVNNTRVTIPAGQGGWYAVSLVYWFTGGSTGGNRQIDVRKNAGGLPILPDQMALEADQHFSTGGGRGSLYGECELVAGDFLQVIADHLGGGGVSVKGVLTVRRIY